MSSTILSLEDEGGIWGKRGRSCQVYCARACSTSDHDHQDRLPGCFRYSLSLNPVWEAGWSPWGLINALSRGTLTGETISSVQGDSPSPHLCFTVYPTDRLILLLFFVFPRPRFILLFVFANLISPRFFENNTGHRVRSGGFGSDSALAPFCSSGSFFSRGASSSQYCSVSAI